MKYKTEAIENIKKFYDINAKTGLSPTQADTNIHAAQASSKGFERR